MHFLRPGGSKPSPTVGTSSDVVCPSSRCPPVFVSRGDRNAIPGLERPVSQQFVVGVISPPSVVDFLMNLWKILMGSEEDVTRYQLFATLTNLLMRSRTNARCRYLAHIFLCTESEPGDFQSLVSVKRSRCPTIGCGRFAQPLCVGVWVVAERYE